jgi:hypothetical protein
MATLDLGVVVTHAPHNIESVVTLHSVMTYLLNLTFLYGQSV